MQDKDSGRTAARRFLIGFVTAVPIVYIFTILFTEGDVGISFEDLRTVHFTIMVLYLVLLLFYVREALKAHTVPDEKRRLWAALLVFGGPAAQAAFYWFYIRPGTVV